MPNEDDSPLLAYADELVNKLRELLSQAIKENDESAIHHSRVATRRLKAAADVFESISSRSHQQDFVKTLRKLRKHLGPARDLDVMLGHLKDFKSDRLKPGIDWLQNQLLKKQQALRQSQTKTFDVPKALARLGAWWGVRQDWTDAGDGLESLMVESLHLQLDQFIEHADTVAGRRKWQGGRDLETDRQMLDPHQLRIAGKALRYTLEMAVEGGHRLPAAVVRAFKRMQESLGLWHDYVVLTERILKLTNQSELGLHDSETTAIILEIARQSVRRAAAQLKRFNKLWITKGEMLTATVRQRFPLTQPVEQPITKSKTDPDPSGSEKSPVDPPKPPKAAPPNEPSAA